MGNRPRLPWVWAGVVVAVLAVSASAIFVKLAEAPALAIAFWRNAIAAGLFLALVVVTGGSLPRGRPLLICLVGGVSLAAHFGLWISSLDHTSVAASVVLVCTQPIFVALIAHFVLHERTSRLGLIGIAAAMSGTTLIGADLADGSAAWLGNLLALGGAVCVAVYVLIGRVVRERHRIDILPYAAAVYTFAALTLSVVCLIRDTPLTDFSSSTWGWILAIAIGPQILGHTLFNWALRYVPAASLSTTILAEPIVSTGLAVVILDEIPGVQTVVGSVVVLLGVAIVLRAR